MDFRLKINIPTAATTISHSDSILLLGSCFTENIGNYLKQFQFRVQSNPFGIIYNPISIFQHLENIANKKEYLENDLMKRNDIYFSLDHHSQFSGINKAQVLTKINEAVVTANAAFLTSKFIIITLGTSFVYQHQQQNRIVANCHKLPYKEFEKKLLRINEIVDAFDKLKNILVDKIVVFTVSPVRHWRDGAIENLRSKSILIESIHQIINANKNCMYFPAYEIMMDELRDYRFYEEDMLHPNKTAVKYIWQQFSKTFFPKETIEINNKIEKINLLLQHRIKQENSAEQKQFEANTQKIIQAFKQENPIIKVDF